MTANTKQTAQRKTNEFIARCSQDRLETIKRLTELVDDVKAPKLLGYKNDRKYFEGELKTALDYKTCNAYLNVGRMMRKFEELDIAFNLEENINYTAAKKLSQSFSHIKDENKRNKMKAAAFKRAISQNDEKMLVENDIKLAVEAMLAKADILEKPSKKVAKLDEELDQEEIEEKFEQFKKVKNTFYGKLDESIKEEIDSYRSTVVIENKLFGDILKNANDFISDGFELEEVMEVLNKRVKQAESIVKMIINNSTNDDEVLEKISNVVNYSNNVSV